MPRRSASATIAMDVPSAAAVAGRVQDLEAEGGAFGRLTGSVDRQMSGMRARLEDARSALAALMQTVSDGEASPMARLQEAGHEGDGVKGLSGFHTMAQLLMEFQEMVLDAGAVRDSVASSFDAMEMSVTELRAAMDEKQWLIDAEKEMYSTAVQGLLREINVESRASPVEGCQPPTLHHLSDDTENSSEECQSLKDETRHLQAGSRISEEQLGSKHGNHSEEHGISREEAERLTEEKVYSEIRCELQDVLYTEVFTDLVNKLVVQADEKVLTEARNEVYIRGELQHEMHNTIFKDLVKKLAAESVDHLIRTSIKDEVHAVCVAKTLNAWKSTTEMGHNERLIKEEIDCIVFGGLTNDLINGHNLTALKSEDENRPSNDLERLGMMDNIDPLQNVNMQINLTTGNEHLVSDQHQVLLKRESSGNADSCDRQNADESDLQDEIQRDIRSVCDSVNGSVEEALEHQRNLQTGELPVSLSMPLEGTNKEMFTPLINFQEMFMNIEAVICGKIGTAVLRLSGLDKQLVNLAEQLSSLKRSEFIYRRAFTWRCCDLQTAEAEVDLLGDEVELLVGLLRKTYKALDHYSPVLQHYVAIKEMMCLLGKELGRHQD